VEGLPRGTYRETPVRQTLLKALANCQHGRRKCSKVLLELHATTKSFHWYFRLNNTFSLKFFLSIIQK